MQPPLLSWSGRVTALLLLPAMLLASRIAVTEEPKPPSEQQKLTFLDNQTKAAAALKKADDLLAEADAVSVNLANLTKANSVDSAGVARVAAVAAVAADVAKKNTLTSLVTTQKGLAALLKELKASHQPFEPREKVKIEKQEKLLLEALATFPQTVLDLNARVGSEGKLAVSEKALRKELAKVNPEAEELIRGIGATLTGLLGVKEREEEGAESRRLILADELPKLPVALRLRRELGPKLRGKADPTLESAVKALAKEMATADRDRAQHNLDVHLGELTGNLDDLEAMIALLEKQEFQPSGKQYTLKQTRERLADLDKRLTTLEAKKSAGTAVIRKPLNEAKAGLDKAEKSLAEAEGRLRMAEGKGKEGDPKPLLAPLADPTQGLDANLAECVDRFPVWLDDLRIYTQDLERRANETLGAVLRDPPHQRSTATAMARIVADASTALTRIVNASSDTLVQLQHESRPKEVVPPDFRLSDLVNRHQVLERAVLRLQSVLAMLQVDLPLDVSTWVSDQVSLYYFDDIPRLMNVLCGAPETRGGDPNAASQANAARAEVEAAGQALADARAGVNNTRRDLEIRREQLRQATLSARDALQRAQNRLRKATPASRELSQRLAAKKAERDQAKADRDLAQTELSRANTTVTTARTDRDNLRNAYDDLVAAGKPADEAKKRLEDAEKRLAEAERRVSTAETRLEKAEQKLAAAEAEVSRAQAEYDAANTDHQAATNEVTTANQRLESLQNEETGLASKVREAETDVATALANVRTAMSNAYLRALADNVAFAHARDNSPFLVSLPRAFHADAAQRPPLVATDPVQRVMLYGFPDSKAIFIRGSREDVLRVKDLIAGFDRPQAQALLSLWTLEISSDGSRSGATRATEALRLVEEELAVSRAQVNTSLALLRECITSNVDEAVHAFPTRVQRARKVADAVYNEVKGNKLQIPNSVPDWIKLTKEKLAPETLDPGEAREVALFAALLFRHQLENGAGSVENLLRLIQNAAPDELAPVAFYDLEVLTALGWSIDRFDEGDYGMLDLLRASTPHPKGVTTLAEALVVLALAERPRQKKIRDEFLCLIDERVKTNTRKALAPGKALRNEMEESREDLKRAEEAANVSKEFPNLVRFLGDGDLRGAGVHSFQQEIVGHLQRNAVPALLAFLDSLVDQESLLEQQQKEHHERFFPSFRASVLQQIADVKRRRSLLPANASVADKKNLDMQLAGLEAQLGNFDLKIDSQAVLQQIADVKRRRSLLPANAPDADKKNLDMQLANLEAQLGSFDATVNKRIDDLKKRAKPALELLERWAGVPVLGTDPVGTLENFSLRQLTERARTSRNSARFGLDNARTAALNEALKGYVQSVDEDLQRQFVQPMFDRLRRRLLDAKVGVGVLQKTSILSSNRLVARVDPRASANLALGETVDALGATQQLLQIAGAAQTGGLTAALGGLERLPREAPPGVYGLTAGNRFQVTPVLDPTGQALRFRFDHVLSTQIREPNGTTDPQLPAIERHGVNTEVQLSNQEIRLISQFDTNAKLGIAPRKTGGLPVVKYVPVLKEIPLIGWFTLRKGRAASVQQSLILGHTTMFPTIGDVVNLLTRPIPVGGHSKSSTESAKKDGDNSREGVDAPGSDGMPAGGNAAAEMKK